jgi:ankyrin repeat protein
MSSPAFAAGRPQTPSAIPADMFAGKTAIHFGEDSPEQKNIARLGKGAAENDLNAIEGMLAQGVYVDAKDPKKNGMTPLMRAAEKDSIDAMKLLCEKGADVNAQDNNGYTALHYAARSLNVKAVKLLIEKEANVNLVAKATTTDWRPLGLAKNRYSDTLTMYGKWAQGRVIKHLRDAGAFE